MFQLKDQYKKILAGFIIGIALLPASAVFAKDRVNPDHAAFGGSSFSWEVIGKESRAKPGDTIDDIFRLKVETYIPASFDIGNLRLDNVGITCGGDNIISEVQLKHGEQELSRRTLTENNGFYRASLEGKEIIIANNSIYNFKIGAKIKKDIAKSKSVECRVDNITFFDLKNNREIYSDIRSKDYTFVIGNKPTFIKVK